MAPLKNTKHEAFANLIARRDKTGMSNTACYVAAGYSAQGNAAEAACSKLLSTAKVQARIAEITAPVVRKSRVTVESLLNELQQTVADARADRQHGAVNSSLALIAKISGLLRDQIEIGGPGAFNECKTPEDVVDYVILDAGGLGEAIDMVGELHRLLIERAADQALPVINPAYMSGHVSPKRAATPSKINVLGDESA